MVVAEAAVVQQVPRVEVHPEWMCVVESAVAAGVVASAVEVDRQLVPLAEVEAVVAFERQLPGAERVVEYSPQELKRQ